jgi:hypothetical protein
MEEPKNPNTTVPGGRYQTADGRFVNANGEPLKEEQPEPKTDGKVEVKKK